MDIQTFRDSVRLPDPPAGIALPLQALWWDAKGDWEKAHACAQADPNAMGAAVHAYLHRKEPDLANAGYWYRRAGRAPVSGDLDQEWQALAVTLLADRAEAEIVERPGPSLTGAFPPA